MYRHLKTACCSIKILNFIPYRNVRNPSRRRVGPKLVDATVKTIDGNNYDELSNVSSLKGYVKLAKTYEKCSEEDVEHALTHDNVDNIISPKSAFRMGEDVKAFVKKQIIKRKYFDLERETNLLTHSAKEQIRYLHRINPTKWTPETLFDYFPTTVAGLKKLLKSNFELRTPERIRKHDDEVEERWNSLYRGESTSNISHLTKRLWNEGKLSKENYKGNPDLPNCPEVDTNQIIKEEKVEPTGEFSEIIRQYVEYKKAKEQPPVETNCDEVLGLKDKVLKKKYSKKENIFNKNKYFIVDDDENDKGDKFSKKFRKGKAFQEPEVLHEQFELNLKEEINSPKHKADIEYAKWLEAKEMNIKKVHVSSKEFVKIPKYTRDTLEVRNSKIANKYILDRTSKHLPSNTHKRKL